MQYDIIGLNEEKTDMQISFPRYIAYKSVTKAPGQRGGTVVLVKRYLKPQVVYVEQVWRTRCGFI